MSKELPTNPDLVIIGAGAAGIAAARRAKKEGLSTIVIEGGNRVGGRAWTQSEDFGVPVDMGCSWLSGFDRNSIGKIAKKRGFKTISHTHAGTNLFRDGSPASEKDKEELERAGKAIRKAINKAARKGLDIPVKEVVPRDLPWTGAIEAWLGPMDYGVECDQISTLEDWNNASDQPSAFVAEGIGTVVARMAKGLPIRLGCPATLIDWSGKGVRVETPQGTLSAKACIITVSVGVLRAGGLRFTPELPLDTQTALDAMPMGLLVKVPLLFDGARLGLGENNWVTYWVENEQAARACYFIAWPCSQDYLFGNLGGKLGWELSREKPEVAVHYALEELIKLVGSDARKHFVKGIRTDWANDPLTCGAYSCVRPGGYGARKKLAEPIAGRLFFAGEATHPAYPALVNGAWDSGKKSVKAVLRALDRQP